MVFYIGGGRGQNCRTTREQALLQIPADAVQLRGSIIRRMRIVSNVLTEIISRYGPVSVTGVSVRQEISPVVVLPRSSGL